MTLFDVLSLKGIDVRSVKNKPNEIKICCPFCDDNRFRLGINTLLNKGHCFNCDWSSSKAIQSLLWALRITATVDLKTKTQAVPIAPEPTKLPDDFTPFFSFSLECAIHPEHAFVWNEHEDLADDLVRHAFDALRSRNVTNKQIDNHRLGTSFSGRYAYRVIFPINDSFGLLGFTAWDYTRQARIKYLHSDGPKFIYGLRGKHRSVILTEGVFDALAVERVFGNEYDCGALLGHTISPEAAISLLCAYDRVVLWLDPDKAGVDGVASVGNVLLTINKQLLLDVVSPKYKADCGDMTPEQLFETFVPKKWSPLMMMGLRLRIAGGLK